MKRLGQLLLGCVFAALLMLSCRALVVRPEADAEAPPPPPVQAALTAASEAASAEDALSQEQPGETSRRLLAGTVRETGLPSPAPVRDGNGTPLGARPYVRTVYTACRLEETSG